MRNNKSVCGTSFFPELLYLVYFASLKGENAAPTAFRGGVKQVIEFITFLLFRLTTGLRGLHVPYLIPYAALLRIRKSAWALIKKTGTRSSGKGESRGRLTAGIPERDRDGNKKKTIMPHEWENKIVVTKEELVPDFFPTWDALRRKLDRDAKNPTGIRRARGVGRRF